MDGRTLWQGFGGTGEQYNDGDPVVQYDKLAHRRVLSQFVVSGRTQYPCVAVSTSDDALDTYHRYQFTYNAMNDFPKLSVWPDAYCVTSNMFDSFLYQGARVCAGSRQDAGGAAGHAAVCADACERRLHAGGRSGRPGTYPAAAGFHRLHGSLRSGVAHSPKR